MKIINSTLRLLGIALLVSCENSGTMSEVQTNNEQTIQMADRIRIDELPTTLTKLKNGQTEFDFIGITSNGIDCIYFVYENGKFNLEFESMVEEQTPFIDRLKEFAQMNELESVMTTYGNQPHYQSMTPAPVIRIESNSTLEEVVALGRKIQAEIFQNNSTTVYDVVP